MANFMRVRTMLILLAALLSVTITTTVTVKAATTFTVTKTADTDDGNCNADCSLREAINAANDTPGLDTIAFNIAGTGVKTIQPTAALPVITSPVILDATTQPGYVDTPLIELNGSLAGPVGAIAVVSGGSTVRGLAINRYNQHAILLTTLGGNTVQSNVIGTNPAGTTDLGNGDGIFVDSVPNNLIGGTFGSQRNLVSGNNRGIIVAGINAKNNIVQGNYVGTNATGTAAIPNDTSGVLVTASSSLTLIGGTESGAGNLISGNNSTTDFTAGLEIGSNQNTVQGNLIGTNAAGTSAIPNGRGGIWIRGGANNIIGGSAVGAGNIIAYNNGQGIQIADTTGTGVAANNLISRNSIYSNTDLGIDLGESDGVAANDPGDSDNGPNKFQNFPVLTSATRTATSISISGTYNSQTNRDIRVEFFSNVNCDGVGFGEGQTYLGSSTIHNDGSGNASISASFLANVPAGYSITATATDLNEFTLNNTSEFSECITVTNAPTGSTFNVTKTADTNDGVCNAADCSLREAIGAANAQPGSIVNIPAGTYVANSFIINANMTLNGASAATTIIDGNLLESIFIIHSGFAVSMNNLTVRRASSNGSGGGIVNLGGVLTLTSVNVTSNSVHTLDNTAFGGGLYASAGSTTSIINSTISNNTADTQGAGIYNGGILSITNSTITGNTLNDLSGSHEGGGGIYSVGVDSQLSVYNSVISNNTAFGGAGIWSHTAQPIIDNTVFSNNTGGALYTNGALIVDSTFSGNTYTNNGAAILTAGKPLNISNSTFSNNSSTIGGGAIWAWRISINITNSTFSGNSSPLGGAILAGDDTDGGTVSLNLTNVTIAGSTSGGGVYVSKNATVKLHGTILSGNAGGDCRISPIAGGVYSSEGFNLSSDSTCNPYLTSQGDLPITNAQLGTLADNGGLTDTIALGGGSPAANLIPQAYCRVETDQRGVIRPYGSGCDSGAYELNSETSQTGPTFTVNTTGDSNDAVCGSLHCTLREAIVAANTTAGSNTIAFNIGAAGVQTIKPTTPLPAITGAVVIDATTQPGYAGLPLIELDGSTMTGTVTAKIGLLIQTSSVTVRGLIINRFGYNGIQIANGNGSVLIENNYIGTNAAGTSALGNGSPIANDAASASGIAILSVPPGNTIKGNLISGNANNGIFIQSSTNVVENNRIGTNAARTAVMGTQANGISMSGGQNNRVGGTTAGKGNLIAGNGVGISIGGSSLGSLGYIIQGNFIGTDITGALALGNTTAGIKISDANAVANGVTIGGTGSGAGNIIANNSGNASGIMTQGTPGKITIQGNRIFGNGGLGIDLGTAGVTPNDVGDADTGANGLQNFPILTGVTNGASNVTITGTLNSLASKTYRIEFFTNGVCDVSGNGEGTVYFGTVNATTAATGNATFNAVLTGNLSPGTFVTATATDPDGNTSEFSTCLGLTSALDAAPLRNYYTTATPTLTWGAVSWATGYDVEVSRNNTFTDKVFVGSTANLSIITTALGDGTYFWRVRAKAPGRTGNWSVIDTFVVDVP